MSHVPYADTPIHAETVFNAIHEAGIPSMAKAGIRELVSLVNKIEQRTGDHYIRMEMGVPGLPAPEIGIAAEAQALQSGVGSK